METTVRADPFEVDPWRVVERGIDEQLLAVSESVLTVSNGYLGVRGTVDEGEPSRERGTFLAGVHEQHPLSYPEGGFGHPETGEAMVGVADGLSIRLVVDGIPFDVRQADLTSHLRTLDLRAGTLTREVEWTTPAGTRMRLRSVRLVSLVDRSVCAIDYQVEALDAPALVTVRSELTVNTTPSVVDNDDPRVGEALRRPFAPLAHRRTERGGVLIHRTRGSALSVAAAVEHDVEGLRDSTTTTEADEDGVVVTVVGQLHPGTPLRIHKYLAYSWSPAGAVHDWTQQVQAALAQARHRGWTGLTTAQRAHLEAFWAVADVEVDGSPDLQQALRFAVFQVLQATACTDGTSVGAKALSGSGYSGHTFWDVEGFVVPMLNLLRPRSAAALLRWRAGTLALARRRAEQLGLAGASFAWRTISGPEVSAYWPASTAAMHVNADIARAFELYANVTGEPLESIGGLGVLVETARLWMSMGHHDDEGGWHLFGMTGPDEYTGVVDDNVFTNLMAARNLAVAARACRRAPDLAAGFGVDSDETALWQDTSRAVFVPSDDRLGVHPACQNFTAYREWDFEGRQDWYPIQEHAHYGKIYRRQIVKQADLIQALWWCEEHFTDEQIARDLDYYEARTVRDSSLSAAVQAVVCARAGHLDLAFGYLREAALTDLRDVNDDTAQGLHLAAGAGAWLALVAGLGGMREDGDVLRLAPRLPAKLTRFAFHLRWRATLLRVETTIDGTTLSLPDRDDAPVEVDVDGHRITVSAGQPVTRRLVHPVPLLPRPTQPAGRAPKA
jgi:alpha,alpha-trehalose phosphorylase